MENKNKIMNRKDIPAKYRWDIESLYANQSDWQKDFQKVEGLQEQLQGYKKNFSEDVFSFLRCLQLRDQISELTGKIYTYAHMRKDEENHNNIYQDIFYQATGLLVRTQESLSFIEPGILALDKGKQDQWMKKNKPLRLYQHYFDEIDRKRLHILSPQQEEILASAGEMGMAFENSFNMLQDADLVFPTVKDQEGNKIRISHGNFISLLTGKDREFRKKVFRYYYRPYRLHRNTFSALLRGQLKKDYFYSYARKYKNTLQAVLFEDNIPISVYRNLLNVVHENIGLLHRYIRLKKEFLNLKTFHMYDLYVPLTKDMANIDYSRAQDIIKGGLAPLGDRYLSIIREGFRDRWIDVYENKGKTGGAYSTGSYKSKPFILMNYQGKLEDVYTLAHELGHSLHSYYSHKNQPFLYSNYSIFLAEIASTTNEALLTYHLLEHSRNKNERLLILNHFLEQFRTTLFRQTMFAEFEQIIHEYDEKGKSLTADWLSLQYNTLNHYYYGKEMEIDPEINMEWARIPHFYYCYYVYQYATGFSIATAISRKILQEGFPAVQKYLAILSKGDSEYPVSLLRQAGIDITSRKFLEEGMKLFAELLNQLEDLKE